MILSELRHQINRILKRTTDDHVWLEANDSIDTFALSDGGLCSVFQIYGSSIIVERDSHYARCLSIYKQLAGALVKPGHRFQFVFVRDKDRAALDVEACTNGCKDAATNHGIALHGLIEARRKVYTEKTLYERCYLVLTTKPSALEKDALTNQLKRRQEIAEGAGVKPGEFAQSPFVTVPALRDIHSAFVMQIERELGAYILYHKMSCHEALVAIKHELEPALIGKDWRPTLIGDRYSPRLHEEKEGDLSHVMTPSISHQLFSTSPITTEDPTIIGYAERFHAPIFIEAAPQENYVTFRQLFESVDKNVPYRFSLTIDTGHDKVKRAIQNKRQITSFFAFANTENKMIIDAADSFLQLAAEGLALVSASISMCTWGSTFEEARRRKSAIRASLQSWGYTLVNDERGSAWAAFVENLPAVSDLHVTPSFPLLFDEALCMAPIARTASIFKPSSAMYRTMDGRLYPIEPCSATQETWIDLTFAPPGKGKSNKVAADNTSLLLDPKNRALPRITIIDIGISSANWVDMVKALLPPEKRYLCANFRIKNSFDFAVNPFDLPLGAHYPTGHHEGFLQNFLNLLLTPAGTENVQGIFEFASTLIREMYRWASEQPIRYNQNVSKEVDTALAELGVHLHKDASWYDVRDILFISNKVHEAHQAQLNAMPTLSHAASVLTWSPLIQQMYSTGMIGTEPALDYINRMLVNLTASYKLLTRPTVFSTGEARVISLNLEEVATKGSAAATKQTAIMYMLARHVGCQSFYVNSDTPREIAERCDNKFREQYFAYHIEQVDIERGVPKKLVMDEFHRTSDCPQVRDQAQLDGREGRKYNVLLSLISQNINDFSEELRNLATNVYILGANSEEDLRTIIDMFKPGPDAVTALRRDLRGVDPVEGSSMLYLGATKFGRVQAMLRLSLPAYEYWSYTTTTEDTLLREKAGSILGIAEAVAYLADTYPFGVKNEIAKVTKLLLAKGEKDADPYAVLLDKMVNDVSSNSRRHRI